MSEHHWLNVAGALDTAKETGSWKERCRTWTEYVREEYGLTPHEARRKIGCMRLYFILSLTTDFEVPKSERMLAPFLKLGYPDGSIWDYLGILSRTETI